MSKEVGFLTALLSGAVAGTTVDVALFPQAPQGFLKAGGFKGIYKGLGAAAAGSAPGAALFFCTYETLKKSLSKTTLPQPVVHVISACCGEVVACLVRVPTETVKQRMQAGQHSTLAETLSHGYHNGGVPEFYKGFGITIMREIPFAFIQFPIYEYLKKVIANFKGTKEPASYEAAVCGSVSGGIAAALTTPLDVLKTRLMLGKDVNGVPYYGIMNTFQRLLQESQELVVAKKASSRWKGYRQVLFAGVEPRVMWISIGGFVFFGAYEQSRRMIDLLFHKQ